jgi:hypothetical protein
MFRTASKENEFYEQHKTIPDKTKEFNNSTKCKYEYSLTSYVSQYVS